MDFVAGPSSGRYRGWAEHAYTGEVARGCRERGIAMKGEANRWVVKVE